MNMDFKRTNRREFAGGLPIRCNPMVQHMAGAGTAAFQGGRKPAPTPVQTLVPFTAAAHEHTEPGGFDFTATPTANTQNFGPFDVPAFGFARHLIIEVTTTGAGVFGPGVIGQDYPFNIINSLSLSDVNGAPIFGPYTGYETLVSNLVGGYAYRQDPRSNYFSGSGTSPVFYLRIPIEISHFDGLGALANQNAAAAYKLAITLNSINSIYATAPTTPPTLRFRAWLEAWTLPADRDYLGRPQQVFPPAHGTTQYWSKFTKAVAVGQNSILLPRVGNLVRNIVVIARNNTLNAGAGIRDNSVWPDPVRLQWDQRDLYNESQGVSTLHSSERIESPNNAGTVIDTGVFVYSFSHSNQNRSGDGPANLWLPTSQSTRLEFSGNSATAGNITVLTNDVAPAEISPSERFSEGSASGGSPGARGSVNAGAYA